MWEPALGAALNGSLLPAHCPGSGHRSYQPPPGSPPPACPQHSCHRSTPRLGFLWGTCSLRDTACVLSPAFKALESPARLASSPSGPSRAPGPRVQHPARHTGSSPPRPRPAVSAAWDTPSSCAPGLLTQSVTHPFQAVPCHVRCLGHTLLLRPWAAHLVSNSSIPGRALLHPLPGTHSPPAPLGRSLSQ